MVGHAVFALAQSGRHLEALQIAEACQAAEWWCEGLEMLVFQSAGRPGEASARLPNFRRKASDESLCEFQDATWLLGSHLTRNYIGLPRVHERWTKETCAARLAASDTIFWLADPLYVVEGNDRQAGHLVRGIEARLYNDFRSAGYAGVNRPAQQLRRGLLTRRGPWDSYDRVNRRAVVVQGNAFRIWASEHAAPYHFVPDFPGDGLAGFDRPTWSLVADLEDEGYKPSYGTFHLVPTQIARFRKLDSTGSMKVAAATSVRGTPLEDAAESGYLVFTDAPGSFPLQLDAPFHEGRGVYLAEAESKPYVVSFEILTPGRIGWHREKIWPIETSGPGLSDLLLFRPTGLQEPDSLLAAAALMLPSPKVAQDERQVGFYWESYGLRADAPVQFELEVEGEEGLMDRIRRVLPGGVHEGQGRLGWSEPAGEDGFGRALILDLENLPPGSYTIMLRARQGGGEPVETQRVLEVR